MIETETDRLICRRPSATSSGDYRRLFTEPEVEQWLRPPPMKGFEPSDFERMLARDRSHWQTHGFGPWVLIDRDTEDFVGRAGLNWTRVDGRDEVELPWALRVRFHGRGLATEAALAAIETARGVGLSRVVSLTLIDNRASRRVMEKIGLRYSGDVPHAGLPHALYVLEL
ncbi:MAG TPA: GNAT family N-acetyltransferase [Solirubrobacterales bacterium]|nr:GNAT family N-acetyltransferase [Solirubrobacterales bacterium]